MTDSADFPHVDVPKPRKRRQDPNAKRANDVPIDRVAAWLGLMPDGVLRCPAERENDPEGPHTGVVLATNTLKCFHSRCRQRGIPHNGSPKSGGCRPCVVLVAEVKGIDEEEAARLILAQFDPPPKVELSQVKSFADSLRRQKKDDRLEHVGVQLSKVCTEPPEPIETQYLPALLAALGKKFRQSDARSIAEHLSRGVATPIDELTTLVQTAQAQKPPPKVQQGDDDRVQITTGSDLHRVVDETVAELPRDKDLYQRDGKLVRMVRVAEPDPKRERAQMSVGTPQLRPVEIPTLRERLTRLIDFGYLKEDDEMPMWISSVPDDQITRAVSDRAEWPGVPPIVGVVEAPTMRPDGSILDVPGYDAATGYLYAPTRAYPPVPTNPTWEDARAALDALLEAWMDFCFARPVMVYVPIANQLTIQARPAIEGEVPGFVYDASTRGSGKTLAQKCVSLLATGRECALATWPRNDEELEKVLASYALRGASVIAFDNLASVFGGSALDKVLTASDRVELRILGKSEMPALPWRAVVSVSGNNAELGGDTTRRVLVARLEPSEENPEERTQFRISGGETALRQWCRNNHPRMVVAGLTLLRAYVLAGRPKVDMRAWTYGAWCSVVPSAIRWAGGTIPSEPWPADEVALERLSRAAVIRSRAQGPRLVGELVVEDVMACRPTIQGDEDDHTASLRIFLAKFVGVFGFDGANAATIVDRLFPGDPTGRDAVKADAMKSELKTAIGGLCPTRPGIDPNAHQLGRALRRVRRRVVGGKYLDFQIEHGGAKRWLVRVVGG